MKSFINFIKCFSFGIGIFLLIISHEYLSKPEANMDFSVFLIIFMGGSFIRASFTDLK